MMRPVLWALLIVVAAGCAPLRAKPSQADQEQPLFHALCAASGGQPFRPARAESASKDQLLALVMTSEDQPALRHALRGVDLEAARGTTSTTLLIAAAGVGNVQAMRVLLELGAERDKANRQGERALDVAVMAAQPRAACLLLQRGAQLAPPTQKPYLVPAAALTEDHASAALLVDLLLRAGYGVSGTMNGDTALHIAAELGNRALVQRLLEAGAQAGLKNARGESALDLARRSGAAEIARLLEASASGQGKK